MIEESEPQQGAVKVTESNVTAQELDDLTYSKALSINADKSLAQRAGLFNKSHPGRVLTQHHLRKIFKREGVKRKIVVRRLKSQRSQHDQRVEEQRFFSEFSRAEADGREIVMVDECVFSSKTYQQSAWSRKGENITLSKRFRDMNCVAVVAAISNKRGLIAYLHNKRSIKSSDFCEFLEGMYEQLNSADFTILLDQASVHRSRETRVALEGRDVLYNIPYSPWYNGIELYWALCKQIFRKRLLRSMIDCSNINLSRLTEEALESVEEGKVKKCAESALKRIRHDALEKLK